MKRNCADNAKTKSKKQTYGGYIEPGLLSKNPS